MQGFATVSTLCVSIASGVGVVLLLGLVVAPSVNAVMMENVANVANAVMENVANAAMEDVVNAVVPSVNAVTEGERRLFSSQAMAAGKDQ
jgi:hypothetical protein